MDGAETSTEVIDHRESERGRLDADFDVEDEAPLEDGFATPPLYPSPSWNLYRSRLNSRVKNMKANTVAMVYVFHVEENYLLYIFSLTPL